MVLRFSHFRAFSVRGSHLDHIFVPKQLQEPPDQGPWVHLGTFLTVFFISLGRCLGPPALSEPCLGASWSQTVLRKPSKTVPKTNLCPKILKFPRILAQKMFAFQLISIFQPFQFSSPAILQSSNLRKSLYPPIPTIAPLPPICLSPITLAPQSSNPPSI